MRTPALTLGLILTLTGCGGGGGDDSTVRDDPPPAPERLTFPVDTARQFGRLSPLTATDAQLRAHDASVFRNADTIVSSDQLFVIDGAFERVTVDCSGADCFAGTAASGFDRLTVASFEELTLRALDGDVLPVGQRDGIHMLAFDGVGDTGDGETLSVEGYGGWMNYGAFVVMAGEFNGGELDGIPTAFAYSYGDSPGTSPAVGASWTGLVAGVDVSETETTGNVIQGQARIEVVQDFVPTLGDPVALPPQVDVQFTGMYDLDARTQRSSMSWYGVELTERGFRDESSTIEGRFYGPDHEEAGGVFENHGILGAFGATRE